MRMCAAGEMCLILDNLHERLHRRRAPGPVARCLFGAPDPAETEKLLQEELRAQRERFQRRWQVDLAALEAAIAREEAKAAPEQRIPSAEERLRADEDEEQQKPAPQLILPKPKGSRRSKKPGSKFQKRVRVAAHKRQTHITEFWRARRSISFVFGKIKPRALLEAPAQ